MLPVSQSHALVRFGIFEADVRSGELRKNGVRVKIQELPFRALKLLLSRPHEIVSRDEFRRTLWPEGVFVDFDHGISSAINRLRDALGDSADNPVFIETVDRRGYRWIAPTYVPTPPLPPGPKLVTPVRTPASASTVASQAALTAVPSPKRHPTLLGRSWVLIFPALALLLAAWGFKPVYRAAKAAVVKPANASHITSASTGRPNSEAEQFYLKGRFFWDKRTPEALNKAVDSFTQAIVQDPTYAPAYVGLADCYNLMREYTLMPASEAYPRALAAAKRAVELDDHSSEAHAALAFALFWGSWDSAGAEREFRRAIELNPNNAVAHHWYSTYLGTIGRHDESLAEIERAQMLDPASKSILADKGQLLAGAGRRNEAVTLLKQLETAEPDFISPHRYLKEMDFTNADFVGYLSEWRKEAALMHDESALQQVDAAEKGYAAGGATGMMRNIQTQQRKLYESGSLSPFALARTDALLGDKQEALRLLASAYQKHDENAVSIPTDPSFKSLQYEPAYQDLVSRLTFPAQD
jgi:DNA-binding winged helix-turn-helix (wHTH) protein/tetratricopeptide (TPR) repeat protein